MVDINKEYFSDNPYSYGGKYRLYDVFEKSDGEDWNPKKKRKGL